MEELAVENITTKKRKGDTKKTSSQCIICMAPWSPGVLVFRRQRNRHFPHEVFLGSRSGEGEGREAVYLARRYED